MKGKEESENVGLKLNIQKTKIMASSPITSWEIDGETVADFIFPGSKITADSDCSHEIKRRLFLGRKVMINLLLLLLLSCFSHVWLCATPEMAVHQAPRPWDSPGKNTGVGCHFLLQCMKVKSEREVAQSCPTLSDPMDCSLPGSSIHEIFQARQHIKKQRHYFVNKEPSSQGYGFYSGHVWMWELDNKESWAPKSDAFVLWCWRRLSRVPWTARWLNPSIL